MRDSDIATKPTTKPDTRWPFAVLLVLLVLIGGILSSAATAGAADTTSLVVKLAGGLTPAQQAAVIARDGGIEKSSIPALRLYVLIIPTSDLQIIQQNYQNDPQVKSIEMNKTRKVEVMSNDIDYSAQWALPKIGWESVFSNISSAGSAKVAILDTGIDVTHPDLAGNVTPGTSILVPGANGQTDPNPWLE